MSQFWRRMSRAAALLPKPAESPFGAGLELVIRSLSPYQFNPFNLNPLREALLASVDFERLRGRSAIKLLLAATRVSDGRLRILHQPRTDRRRRPRLGLPAPASSHDRNRRRGLLGRRLRGQSAADPAHPGLRMRSRAHRPGHADQVGPAAEVGARYRQAHRADPVQRDAQQRARDAQIRENDRGDREAAAAAHRPHFGRRGIRGLWRTKARATSIGTSSNACTPAAASPPTCGSDRTCLRRSCRPDSAS